MHDLHLANKVHKLILEEAQKNHFKKVMAVEIELGAIVEHGADVNPENLKFNLQMLGVGTPGERAVINVKKISGNDWRLGSLSGE